MKLPAFLLPPLLRLHAWGSRRPYFDLPGYMQRGWVLGYRSAERNAGNPEWHGHAGGRLHAWLTSKVAIRAHTILRSDDDRALHDHPADSISVVLDGGYWEVCEPTAAAIERPHTYGLVLEHLQFARSVVASPHIVLMARAFGVHWRGPGAVVYRRAEAAHRLVIPTGHGPARTLWLIGPKRRSWGFHAPGGWRHWRDYLDVPEKGGEA